MGWDGTYGYSKFGYPKNTIIDIDVILTKIGDRGRFMSRLREWTSNACRMLVDLGTFVFTFSSIHHAWWFPSEKYVFEGGLRTNQIQLWSRQVGISSGPTVMALDTRLLPVVLVAMCGTNLVCCISAINIHLHLYIYIMHLHGQTPQSARHSQNTVQKNSGSFWHPLDSQDGLQFG